jgi:hypothetical protein
MVMRSRSRRGFVTLDVLWIILLLCLAAYLSVRGIGLVDQRDKAERLQRELIMIGEAVEDAAAADGLEPGAAVPFARYSQFLEERVAKRVRLEGIDPFGGLYGEQIVGEEAVPAATTITSMGELWK